MARKRLVALAVGVIFCLTMVFSFAFVMAHADHDCIGEGCPVCREIAACLQTLRSGTAAAGLIAVAVAGLLFALPAAAPVDHNGSRDTLITLKVKLSN